jgi:hypothetical protein
MSRTGLALALAACGGEGAGTPTDAAALADRACGASPCDAAAVVPGGDAGRPPGPGPDGSVGRTDAASGPDETDARVGDALRDAAPGPPDAAPGPPDAAPGPPDAAPGPDARLDPPDAAPPPPPLPWGLETCLGLDVGGDPFAGDVAAFADADDVAPPPPGGLVVTGSSTIRRWETAARALSAWDPVQRGMGGARLADIAHHVEDLVLRHRPAGVVVFAGTNDIADGRPPEAVVAAYQCLVARVHDRAPGTPLLYVAITPTPARWGVWPQADAANRAIAALAAMHPALAFVDTTPAFLATGSPPAARLFVGDGLHLSTEGYALFETAVVEAVSARLPPAASALPPGPPPGRYVRVDFGPSNPEDGRAAPASDGFGNRWNTFPGPVGGQQILAGRALRGLFTTTNEATAVEVVLAGGFRANGLRNGGLQQPEFAHLGTLAVPEATGDFFYTEGPDDPGALTIGGLSPAARHTLRLFASRLSPDEVRRTRFVVQGAGAPVEATVVTTGNDVGAAGADGNTGDLVVFSGLRPDARGRLHVDVQIAEGRFAYLNLLEVETEGEAAPEGR